MAKALRLAVVLAIVGLSLLASEPSLAIDEEEEEDLELLDLEEEDLDSASSSSSSSASAKTASTLGQAQKKHALADLTDDNAERIIGSHHHVLLLGYAPWCTRSSALMPEFAAAAIALRDSGSSVLLAKLDGVAQQQAATLYGIKGYPTLLFFTDGTPQPYTGGFTWDEIVLWIRKRTGPPATTISTAMEAEEVLKPNATIVVGYFEKFEGQAYEEFVAAAKAEDETEFLQVDNEDVAKLFNCGFPKAPPSICILKSEPEAFASFEGDIRKQNILWFVEVNKRPLVTRLDHQNFGKLHLSPIKLQLTAFADGEESKLLLPLLQDVAKLFKGQILFLLADTSDEDLSRPILTLYGLEPDGPIVTAFDNNKGFKYLLEKELTSANLIDFCSRLLDGKLRQYYKSEPIPTENHGDTRIVVGKTFEEIVLDKNKDVLLEVYTPWCFKCKAVSKVVEKVGKNFRDIPSIVIAKIDGAANEHPLLQVDDYPSLFFYPAGDKKGPIPVPKKWTAKELAQFIHDHALNPTAVSHSSEKDEL